MRKEAKKSICKCYYGDKFGCKFKKSCNFPICRFYTTKKPENPINNYKEYLKIRRDLADRKLNKIFLDDSEVNMPDRKYIIETKRYIGKDGKITFDSWTTSADMIEIKQGDQYLAFYPIEGEYAGKKLNIPFSNIHIVREL